MGKGNLNPADAFRKAQRKKELKKNKAERSKARDLVLVKKNTWDLEDEIKKLEDATDPSEKSRLADLKAELERINKKKAKYVADHPEQRRLVYRPRPKEGDALPAEIILPKRKLFKRAPLPGEVWSDVESISGDEDIAMPEGPPPGTGEGLDYEVDDIPMPESPPPGELPKVFPPLPSVPAGLTMIPGNASPTLVGFTTSSVPGLPPLPPDFVPPGYPPFPPPGAFPHRMQPPPGFFPRRIQSASSIQDPLCSVPHQTFQVRQTLVPHPSLPSKPVTGSTAVSLASNRSITATVVAAPELRDLKKEATTFVPSALKRKKARAPSSKINAAPVMDPSEPPLPTRPDLLATLKDHLGPVPTTHKGRHEERKKSDYDKFLDEMNDILGPSQ